MYLKTLDIQMYDTRDQEVGRGVGSCPLVSLNLEDDSVPIMASDPSDSSTKEQLGAPFSVFILILSIYAVAALALATFVKVSPGTRAVLGYADTFVCGLFFVDFIVTLWRSPNRSRYFFTWGWLDLLSSVPAIDSLRWGRAARILRIFRVLRGIRATKVLSEFILYRRAQSGFLAALLVSVLLVVLSACAVLLFETSPEANIRSPEDAVWWAVVTVTTVGYGDKFPLSSEGRMIAALLMTAGVGLFGTFSGFVASWFLESPARRSDELEAIQALNQQVAELRNEIRISREPQPNSALQPTGTAPPVS